MDARGEFAEHESSVRVLGGAANSNRSFFSENFLNSEIYGFKIIISY